MSKSRDWLPYAAALPMEHQGIAPFCTSFACCNALEVMYRERDMTIIDLSDRNLAVEAGTTKTGRGIGPVLNTLMNPGTVLEEECPFPWLYRIFYLVFWSRICDISWVDPNAERFRISNWDYIGTDEASLMEGLEKSPLLLLIEGYKTDSRHVVVGLRLVEGRMTVFDSVLFKFRDLTLGTDRIFEAETIQL